LVALAYFGADFSREFKDFRKVLNFRLQESGSETPVPRGELVSKFALLSDTHSDTEMTKKALAAAKNLGAQYILHSGDWTTVGTIEELEEQKHLFDQAALAYWGVPGDHDLWQSGLKNFRSVFGRPYESFDRSGVHHILLDTSDTDIGFGEAQLSWLKSDLAKTKLPTFIFTHLPPYHPYSARTVWEKGGQNLEVKKQVDLFLQLVKGKVMAVFAGDHHFSASYTEPSSGVKIVISGAVTSSRNLQEPRFNLVEVYESGDFKLTEVTIK